MKNKGKKIKMYESLISTWLIPEEIKKRRLVCNINCVFNTLLLEYRTYDVLDLWCGMAWYYCSHFCFQDGTAHKILFFKYCYQTPHQHPIQIFDVICFKPKHEISLMKFLVFTLFKKQCFKKMTNILWLFFNNKTLKTSITQRTLKIWPSGFQEICQTAEMSSFTK